MSLTIDDISDSVAISNLFCDKLANVFNPHKAYYFNSSVMEFDLLSCSF